MAARYRRSVTFVLAAGTCLSGRFRLDGCIGEGGMGVVWAATNTNTLRRVALKFLKPEGAGDRRVRRRFLREARAASAVSHPNVVEILDVLELDDGAPAMVMELLEGESLARRLRRQGRFDVAETASIMLPAMAGVGAAHAVGIVHRDLKPDNIFLAHAADGAQVVKVLDFGIAKVSVLDHEAEHTEALTGTGAVLGTPYYMSPEQVFADPVVDYRSDIWALGVILYQCLTGTRPTQAENVGQIMKIIMSGSIVPLEKVRPELPNELTTIIGRMLSSDRSARPQSLKEVCAVLRDHSDVNVATFGDPVFVNVVAAPDPSSSEIKGAAEHATLVERTADLLPTREERSSPDTRIVHDRTNPSDEDAIHDSLRTEKSLALSLSGQRLPMARRGPLFVALGVGIVVLFAVGALTRTRGPTSSVTSPSIAIEPAASTTGPRSPAVSAPEVAKAPSAATLAAAAQADSEPLVAPARPSSPPGPPLRRPQMTNGTVGATPPARPASPAASTTTTSTNAPGGLVDKPPF
jgi:eukaryotic-like serine/threonine-protein kinase